MIIDRVVISLSHITNVHTVKIWVLCQHLLGRPVACLKTAPQGCYKKCYCNSPLVFPLHLCGIATTPKLNSTQVEQHPKGCYKKCYCNSPLVFSLHLCGVATTSKLNSAPRVLQKVLLQLPSSVSTAPFWCSNNIQVKQHSKGVAKSATATPL